MSTQSELPPPSKVEEDPVAKLPKPPNIAKNDPQAEVKKMLYQAKIDVIKAERQAVLAENKANLDAQIEKEKRESTAIIETIKADWVNEYAQAQAVHSAYLEVAKGSLDRAAARASFVQGAATAISGVYVGILGISFAVAEGHYLPVRGVVPTLFLGLAIFLATVYISFVTKTADVTVRRSDGTLTDAQRQRRNSFVEWTKTAVLTRKGFLQASVISLGIGAFLLPLPFLDVSDWVALILVLVGLGCIPLFSWIISKLLE